MDFESWLTLSDSNLFEKFRRFHDKDLLISAQYCERFKEIAKEIVAERFNGDSDDKYYDMCVGCNEQAYRRFFEAFSEQITALKLVAKKETNRKVLKLVSQYGRSVKCVIIETEKDSSPVTQIIRSMSNLTSLTLVNLKSSDFLWADERYPHLETLCLDRVINVDAKLLRQFLYINPQLRHLRVLNCERFPLKELHPLRNHLSRLTSLEYTTDKNEFAETSREFKAEHLETLKISTDRTSAANVLNAFGRGSKMVKNLEVIVYSIRIDDDQTFNEFVQSIRSFDQLTSLKLDEFEVGMNRIEILRRNFSKLATLHVNQVPLGEISTDDILHVFGIFTELTDLKLENGKSQIKDSDRVNLEFHQKLVDIARDRGGKINLELIQSNEKSIITEEKIVKNGQLRYWTGYDASICNPSIHLLDLDDRILEKVYDYLDDQAQRTLYDTCTKLRNSVQERIKSQWFTVSGKETARDSFRRFGEHITKLEIDMKNNDPSEMTETWRLIDEHCSKNLVEMSINKVRVDSTGLVPMELPNLSKLTVKSLISSETHIFPLMNCPKLAELELHGDDTPKTDKASKFPPEFGITLDTLTIIRLKHFNENIEKILNHFDEVMCNQMREFTVEEVQKYQMVKIVNIAMRFRSLTTLNLASLGVADTNYEYLFQNCTKLKQLTLFDDFCYDSRNCDRILQVIKENCKQLEVLLLIRRWICFWSWVLQVQSTLTNVKVKRFLYDENLKIYKIDDYKYVDHLPI